MTGIVTVDAFSTGPARTDVTAVCGLCNGYVDVFSFRERKVRLSMDLHQYPNSFCKMLSGKTGFLSVGTEAPLSVLGTGCGESRVCVVDMEAQRQVSCTELHGVVVNYACEMSPNTAIFADMEGHLTLLDWRTCQVDRLQADVQKISSPHDNAILSAVYDARLPNVLITASADDSICVFDLRYPSRPSMRTATKPKDGVIAHMAISRACDLPWVPLGATDVDRNDWLIRTATYGGVYSDLAYNNGAPVFTTHFRRLAHGSPVPQQTSVIGLKDNIICWSYDARDSRTNFHRSGLNAFINLYDLRYSCAPDDPSYLTEYFVIEEPRNAKHIASIFTHRICTSDIRMIDTGIVSADLEGNLIYMF